MSTGHEHDTTGLTITDTHVATSHDKIPRMARLGAPPALSVQSGDFMDPTTWSNGQAPTAESNLVIQHGHTVSVSTSNAAAGAVEASGVLRFSGAGQLRLTVDDILVMFDGALIVTPLDTSEIVFRDSALKSGTVAATGVDPSQYGKGLLCFGECVIDGLERTPCVRLDVEPLVGHATLHLTANPIGWQPGDRILIPDTRQIRSPQGAVTDAARRFTSQAEERTIAEIDGRVVTLDSPLSFDHKGPRDGIGNLTDIERGMFPHVANLTRNIVIRSENPSVVARRGHTMFLHRAAVDISGAAFVGLGRTLATLAFLNSTLYDEAGAPTRIGTNQIGRYSIHLHHLWGPANPDNTGHQFRVTGCLIDDFVKWGLTLHDSHYGLIDSNVCYGGFGVANNGSGSAIATEDGSESYNDITRNFICHSRAGSVQRIMGTSGVGGDYKDSGISRDGFWFRGPNNNVSDNVVCNCPDFAINYNGSTHVVQANHTAPRIPLFRGADMHDLTQTVAKRLAVLKCDRNEVYGATGQGHWISRPQGASFSPRNFKDVSLHDGWKIWHTSHAGVYDWGDDVNAHFANFVIRGDVEVSKLNVNPCYGMSFGDTYYATANVRIWNFDIQGFNIGIQLPHRPANEDPTHTNDTNVYDGYLRNYVNFEDRPVRFTYRKLTNIRNVRQELIHAPWSNVINPGKSCKIWMHLDNRDAHTYLTVPTQLFLYSHNGVEGADYQVYFREQRADLLVPSYRTSRGSLPQATATCYINGWTNQQCWDDQQRCVARELAPANAVDGASMGIEGLVRPLSEDPPPPPPVEVASVEVIPTNAIITVGDVVVFTATVRDASGNILEGRPVEFRVDSPACTVEPNGTVTAVSAGSATLTATSDGKSYSVPIMVLDPPPPPEPTDLVLREAELYGVDADGTRYRIRFG